MAKITFPMANQTQFDRAVASTLERIGTTLVMSTIPQTSVVDGFPANWNRRGTRAQRPTNEALIASSGRAVGFQYYDTTLGKPIWWSGSAWKDANGAVLGTLNNLTLASVNAAIGVPWATTINGLTAGSTVTATSSDGTALTITGPSISGIFYSSGSPTITIVETPAAGEGNPRVNVIVLTVSSALTLGTLSLSSVSASTGVAWSANIVGKTAGSSITATSSDGTVLTVSGTSISGTFTATGNPTVTLVETLAGATGSPKSTTLALAVVTPIALGTLTLSSVSATVGTAWSATISGKTAGSVVTATSSDSTVLSVSGTTISGTFTASGSPVISLVETLSGATGSPKTSTVTLAVASTGGPNNLLLYVVGQSNSRSAGVSGTADIPSEWTALSTTDQQRVKIWDYQNAQWLNYQPGTNAEILATSLWGSSGGKWGPECTFAAKWLTDNPGKTLYIVKLGINGTGLDSTITQPRWNPSDGLLYAGMTTYATAARNNLASSGVSYSMARLMMQGEADAMPPTGSPTGTAYGPATRYQANITAFEASSRTDWCGGSSGVPLVIGRIQALDYPNTVSVTDATNNRVDQAYVVRAGQLAAADASNGVIRIVDLDTGLGGAPVLHPSAAWVRDMGQRMYAAYAGTYTSVYGDIHDATPNAFTIPAKTDQTASTVVSSAVVTITGISMRSPISVSGGVEYRILLADNTIYSGNTQTVYQDWGTASGFIQNNQKIQLRMTSSATAGDSVSGTVTIGGVSATYQVTTTTVTAKAGNTRSNAFESKMAALGATAFSTAQHNAVVDFFAAVGSYLDSGKIKALAIPAVHDEIAARIRWDDQSTVGTKTGTPTWTAALGYNPNATNNTWVDYGYNTATPSQDGLGIGVYIKALSASTGVDVQLNSTPIGLRLLDGGSGSITARAALNGPNASKTWTFTPGLIAAQRTGSAAVRFYNGGTAISGDIANTSTASVNTMLRLGGGTSANRNIGALIVTDGFADADWSAFNTALVALLTVFGAN